MRTFTPPPSTISRISTPAYHTSPGDSETLDESWYPVTSPTSSNPNSNSNSNSDPEHYLSDNDTLSSSIYSVGSDTAASLTSTESGSHDHDNVNEVSNESEMLEGGYIDADASTLAGSITTLANAEGSIPLIYPVYNDLENSFNSSTTTTTTASDGTTPSASVGELHQLPRAQRLSSYRLEKLVQAGKDGHIGGRRGSSQRGSGDYQGLYTSDNALDDKSALVDSLDAKADNDSVAVTAQEIREGVKTDRIRRALATANMAQLRGTNQKWSLKMSIMTLASLLGLVLATVRYSISPASSPGMTEPSTPLTQVKPFSILDYLSPSSLSLSTSLFDPAPSSIMPDVRLIKNALSLSTRPVALAPAEIKGSTSKPMVKTREGEKDSGSTAVALRGVEAGLTAFLHASAWQRAKDMVMPSAPPVVVPTSPDTKQRRQQSVGYGEIIIGDIKAAWTRALSTYSHADMIHYIRNQIIITIQMEIQQAILLAKYVIDLSKNVSQAATPYLHQSVNHARQMYDDIRQYTTTINITASTDIAASKARTGLADMSSRAAMTSQKGREAIQQARAGLEYLVVEARKKAGITIPKDPSIKPQDRGRFRSLRDQFKTHRGKFVQGLNNGKIYPAMPRETSMSMKQKLMQALHNAAMPLVV